MSNININIELSRRTLKRDLVQGTKFLSTLSRSPVIRRILASAAGYTEEDHQAGWSKVHRVLGYQPNVGPAFEPLVQDRALAELDAWDGPAFERTRAAWRYTFPGQLAYVFNDLNAEPGTGAMRTVRTYIDRVVALREGSDAHREGSRQIDKEAVKLLAVRRIFDVEIEARLEALLAAAAVLAPAQEPPPPSTDPELAAAALDLHAWLADWRGQARAVITRREHLIRLGLASRRDGRNAEETDVSEEAAPLSEAS